MISALVISVFFVISFLIANIFLAYVIGSDALWLMIEEGPLQQSGNFIALLIFTGVFYFVFAWFREQVCIIVCPYGRLQGVLLDNKSINVAYDFVRGEKELGRAKFNKKEDRALSGKGDCIDCMQCVHVCPTGIDIRNGTQLECINCTACIDECDTIMEGVGLPKGLIRYASEDEIEKKEPFRGEEAQQRAPACFDRDAFYFLNAFFVPADDAAEMVRGLEQRCQQCSGPGASQLIFAERVGDMRFDGAHRRRLIGPKLGDA